MFRTRPLTLAFLGSLAILSIPLTGCKKQPPAAAPAASSKATSANKAAKSKTAAVDLAKLGFAARLPADTEGYIGTLNLPKHLDALKKSSWAKEADAFLNDKTPAPSAGKGRGGLPSPEAAVQQLLGKDFFVAFGKGASKSLQGWRQWLSMSQEMQYTTIMQNTLTPALGSLGGPEEVLQRLITNEDLFKRAAPQLSAMELPPVMLGIQTEKPEEVIAQLVPAKLLEDLKKANAKVSQATLGKKGSFTIVEGTFDAWLTNEVKTAVLNALPADKVELKVLATRMIEDLQKKTFSLAYGSTEGHVIFAIGATRPNLEFITEPAKSLAARPEMAFTHPHTSDNLLAVAFAEDGLLQASQEPEPLQTMARGVLAGMKESPVFGKMATSLMPKVAALAPLEREVMARKLPTLAAVCWWDKGLHLETKGGITPEGLDGGKPLKFRPLLDDNTTIAGIAYRGDPELSAKTRRLFEGWAGIVHEAAQGLVQSGLGGQDGPNVLKWVESDVLPSVITFYNGSKTLFQQGTGNEHAWIMDLEGKQPPLLNLSANPKAAPPRMPRIALLDDVTNRSLIAENWASMQTALNKVFGAFPLTAGQKLPDPDSRNQPGNLTSYSYALLPGGDDLSPTASISGSLLMIGTSAGQHGDLSQRLIRAKPDAENNIAVWRVNFPAIRDVVKEFSSTSTSPSTSADVKAASKWLSPLGQGTGRMWIEAGNVRTSMTIEIKDVLRYD